MTFQVKKVYQTSDLSIVFKGGSASEKGFLVFKPFEVKNPIYFTAQKPENFLLGGNLCEILRKNLGRTIISKVWFSGKSIGISLCGDDLGRKWLFYDHELYQLDFIDLSSQESFFRVKKGKIYTNRKEFQPEAFASTVFESTSISDYLVPKEESNLQEPRKLKQPRGIYRRKIKRKIKTLKKSLAGIQVEIDKFDATSVQSRIDAIEEEAVFQGELAHERDKLYKEKKRLARKIKHLNDQSHVFSTAIAELTDYVETQLDRDLIENIEGFFRRQKIKWQDPSAQRAKTTATRLPYKVYKIDGLDYRVGKSSRDNDQLVKASAPHDWWTHLYGDSGSHVVIKSPRKDFRPTLPQLRTAGILASFFSSRKKALGAVVVVTMVKHLTKPKGSKAGAWHVKEEKIYDWSFRPDEVRSILDSQVK